MAERHLKVAATKASHGRLSAAIDHATRAIDLQPDLGAAYLLRAEWLIHAGRYQEADADLTKFGAMYPDARGTYFLRAQMQLFHRDGASALDSLSQANSLPTRDLERGLDAQYGLWSNALYLANKSIAEAVLGQADPAANDLQAAITAISERPWYMLNHYCYTAAVAGELELAELACDEAIRQDTRDDGHIYDSRGFVHLKMREWNKAVADYDKSLAETPDLTLSLYGRGVARIATGDTAGGNADIEAAKQGEPDIANIMARLGAPTPETLASRR